MLLNLRECIWIIIMLHVIVCSSIQNICISSKRYRYKLVFRYLESDPVYIVNKLFLLSSRLLHAGCFPRRNIQNHISITSLVRYCLLYGVTQTVIILKSIHRYQMNPTLSQYQFFQQQKSFLYIQRISHTILDQI